MASDPQEGVSPSLAISCIRPSAFLARFVASNSCGSSALLKIQKDSKTGHAEQNTGDAEPLQPRRVRHGWGFEASKIDHALSHSVYFLARWPTKHLQ